MKYTTFQRNLFLALLLAMSASSVFAEETALDRYIAKPDAAYKWSLDSTILGEGYKAYVLALTSQTWRLEKEVDRPVWTHWLTVIVPNKLEHDKALLYIGGGENGDAAPKKVGERTAMLALETNTPVAELGQVPN
ncbi:MAG: PhoPQ-activated protein PqaA family protein, partial [Candidatus Hydrogenedentota bacterium]